MDEVSERRLVENEVIFRESNKHVQEFLEEEGGRSDTMVRFFCECANIDCRLRITLSLKVYKDLHKNKRHFIVVAGHELPEIEEVVKVGKGFRLVEKYMEPPSPESIDAALKNIPL